MTPDHFQLLMARFDKFEEKYVARLFRLETLVWMMIGGLIFASALLGAGVIEISANH